MSDPPRSVDDLLDLFRIAEETLDIEAIDEPVGFTEHGLQCAMALRRVAPADVELQVAGLVHDLGHLACPDDPEAHGRAGGELIGPLLGSRVARLVTLHVPAKRYLVSVDPGYRRQLSPASIRTLATQGGAMDDGDVTSFTHDPLAADAVSLRRADDAAKRPDWIVPDLDWWRPLVSSVIVRT